jgi:hypothetical protein
MMIFGKNEIRVEVYISRSEAETNKAIFDVLHERKIEIEATFGKSLVWQRLDGKKACRIKHSNPYEGYNHENWPEMIDWLVEHIALLEKAFRPEVTRVKNQLQQG